jgi:hypothetical protein
MLVRNRIQTAGSVDRAAALLAGWNVRLLRNSWISLARRNVCFSWRFWQRRIWQPRWLRQSVRSKDRRGIVRVMPFKRSKERIHGNICWFGAHGCLAKDRRRLGNHAFAARAWWGVVETFIDKIDCESDFGSLFAIFLPVILREYF